MRWLKLLEKHCYVIAMALIVAVTLVVCSWRAYVLHKEHHAKLKEEVAHASNQIQRELSLVLTHTEESLHFLGNTILQKLGDKNTPADEHLSFIADLLRSKVFLNDASKRNFAWEVFLWSRPDLSIATVSSWGILKNDSEKSIAKRYYAESAFREPWMLHFDAPSKGLATHRWVIPTGMGITDTNGKPVGILSMGFSTDTLIRNIETKLYTPYIRFVLYHQRGHIALQSSLISNNTATSNQLKDAISAINPAKKFGSLTHNIVNDKYNFTYINQIEERLPYTLLVGYDTKATQAIYHQALINELSGYTIISLLSMMVLIFSRRRLIHSISGLTNETQQISVNQHHQPLPRYTTQALYQLSIQIARCKRLIRRQSRTLSQQHKLIEAIELAEHEKECLLYRAHDLIQQTWRQQFSMVDFNSNDSKMHLDELLSSQYTWQQLTKAAFCDSTPHLQYINLYSIFKKSLIIQNPIALRSNQEIIQRIEHNIPPLRANEVLLMLVTTSTLWHVLLSSPHKKKLYLYASVEYGEDNTPLSLVLKIGDKIKHSSNMEADNYAAYADYNTKSNTEGYDCTRLSVSCIRNIVAQHQGSFEMYTEQGQGTRFIIQLPYRTEESATPEEDNTDASTAKIFQLHDKGL